LRQATEPPRSRRARPGILLGWDKFPCVVLPPLQQCGQTLMDEVRAVVAKAIRSAVAEASAFSWRVASNRSSSDLIPAGFVAAVSRRALFCGRICEFFHPSGRKPHFPSSMRSPSSRRKNCLHELLESRTATCLLNTCRVTCWGADTWDSKGGKATGHGGGDVMSEVIAPEEGSSRARARRYRSN
jgi:hypothetical protein